MEAVARDLGLSRADTERTLVELAADAHSNQEIVGLLFAPRALSRGT